MSYRLSEQGALLNRYDWILTVLRAKRALRPFHGVDPNMGGTFGQKDWPIRPEGQGAGLRFQVH